MNAPETTWSDADSARAREIWESYQKEHDVSAHMGQAAGIDPLTGSVWFGESAQDIFVQRRAAGLQSPFYCVRVGADFYVRKGGHR